MQNDIAHLVIPSPLGALTLFADANALLVIEAGRAPNPGEGSPLLTEAKRQLDAYFDGRLTVFDLPLAPAVTPRRRDLLAAIGRVPYGRTKTYGEIATQIGSSARAVGGACAANPLPIVIPCHRILGADGGTGHYSFADGPDTKARLLRLEGIAV